MSALLRSACRVSATKSFARTLSSQAFDGEAAEAYAIIFESAEPSWHKHVSLIQSFSDGTEISILDIGSGPGEPACTFAASFPKSTVTCTDFSADMVEKAKARADSKGAAGRPFLWAPHIFGRFPRA